MIYVCAFFPSASCRFLLCFFLSACAFRHSGAAQWAVIAVTWKRACVTFVSSSLRLLHSLTSRRVAVNDSKVLAQQLLIYPCSFAPCSSPPLSLSLYLLPLFSNCASNCFAHSLHSQAEIRIHFLPIYSLCPSFCTPHQ